MVDVRGERARVPERLPVVVGGRRIGGLEQLDLFEIDPRGRDHLNDGADVAFSAA